MMSYLCKDSIYMYVYVYVYISSDICLNDLVFVRQKHKQTQMHRLHSPNSGRAPVTAVNIVIRAMFFYFPFTLGNHSRQYLVYTHLP